MSFPVIERTFAYTTQRGSFLAALFFLADRADEDGVSWYGVKKIAQAINLSSRQTRHILRALRECGEIWYTPRFFADGSQSSNGYLVCCGASLDVIRAALYHPELQLSDEGIEAALSEIAAARAERLTGDRPWTADDGLALTDDADQLLIGNAEVALSDVSCVERTHDDVAEPANGLEAEPVHSAVVGPEHSGAGTCNHIYLGHDPLWAVDGVVAVADVSGEARTQVADEGCPDIGSVAFPPDARPPPNGTPAGLDADALWDRVLSDLHTSMPREVFNTHLLDTSAEWVGDVLSPSKDEPRLLRVRASPVSVPWLVHRYQERAERFAADHAGQPVPIAFVGRTPARGPTTRCRVNGGCPLGS